MIIGSISFREPKVISKMRKEDNEVKHSTILLMLLAVVLFLVVGCEKKVLDRGNDEMVPPGPLAHPGDPPEPLVTVDTPHGTLEFWPWTANDFSGTPWDPVNVIFVGEVDPRALRAALMFLDGDRTDYNFPDEYPFNSTWHDAIGGVQVTYGDPNGWVGNAIQLECGDYDPIRFHFRPFDVGGWTMGGVHFEIIIPGTTEHQVISWELAEQLLVVDFLRSGLLDEGTPMFPTEQINDSPWREIPPEIYNELPLELRIAIGGPQGNVTEPVPIGTDGHATVLNVAEDFGWNPEVARQSLTINFDQVIPKPFCSGDSIEYIYVEGPVDLNQTVRIPHSGNLVSHFRAHGRLDITPVDISTTPPTPIGETYRAVVNEHHRGIITNEVTLVSSFQLQVEIPPSGPFRGRLISRLEVGPHGHSSYVLEVECGD